MKFASRFLSLLLAAALCLGCAAWAEEEKSPLYIEGSEGVTLTYWIPMDGTQSQYFTNLNQHPFFQWMEEQTGVHIEFVHPSEEQMDTQFTLMMSSGKYYDLMYCPSYPDGPQAAVDDSVFVDLNKYAEYMPNYQAALRVNDGSMTAWEWGEEKALYSLQNNPAYIDNAQGVNGALWCVTAMNQISGYGAYSGILIRQDWLDEAGLDIPETVDELETVLEAFKQRGSDVIPMSLSSNAYQGSSGIFVNMYDLFPAWYTLDENKQVKVYAGVDDAFKDYLILMNKWYEAGYIDPDFMNREAAAAGGYDSLLLNDRLGIVIEATSAPQYYEALYTGEQDFRLSAMPMPRLTHEQTLHYNSCSTAESRVGCYTVISGTCENKEIAAQWLDVLFSKEAYLRANYGVEGESYVLENGVPYFTDWFYHNDKYDVDTLRKIYLMYGKTSGGVNYSGLLSYRSRESLASPLMDTAMQKTAVNPSVETAMVWARNSVNTLGIGWVSFEGDAWGRMYDPYTEAETYAQPMILKFITGVESIEDKWDEYQKTALELGFAESREEMQKAYDACHN